MEDLWVDHAGRSGHRPLRSLGTGYYDPAAGQYRYDLLGSALRIPEDQAKAIVLPRVAAAQESVGIGDSARGWGHIVLGPGGGDNAMGALGIGMGTGDVSVSIGTSGVVAATSRSRCRIPVG